MESNPATAASEAAAFPVHSRLLAVTGLITLIGLILHLATHWPVAHGNSAWLAQHSFSDGAQRGLGAGFVGLYAALGLGLWVRRPAVGFEDSLLLASGALTFGYIVWHSWPFVSMFEGPHHSSLAVLQEMLDQGAGTARQVIPVIGACALGLHIALGAPRALRTLSGLPIVCFQVPMQLLAAAVLVALAHLISYLATGFGLW